MARPEAAAPLTPFTGAVLAGGRGTRLGAGDKALVDVGGRPLVAVAVAALRAAGAAEVVAVGGDEGRLGAIGFDRWVPDEHPGEGPLGGVVTALRAAAHEVVVVLACDLPSVAGAAVRAVVEGLGDAPVAVAVAGGRRQPLLAAWRRAACLPVLDAAFAAGERSPARALSGLAAATVPLADPGWAVDVDTPADLAAARSPSPSIRRVPEPYVPEVDVDAFASAHAAGAPVVDVREPDEYVAGHVPGARLIPLGEVGSRLGEVPTEGTVYVICKTGGRSLAAAQALRQHAGVDAVNVAGGTMAWIESGREVVVGPDER